MKEFTRDNVSALIAAVCDTHGYSYVIETRKDTSLPSVSSLHEEWVVRLTSKTTKATGGFMFRTREVSPRAEWEEYITYQLVLVFGLITPPKENPSFTATMDQYLTQCRNTSLEDRCRYLNGDWCTEKQEQMDLK